MIRTHADASTAYSESGCDDLNDRDEDSEELLSAPFCLTKMEPVTLRRHNAVIVRTIDVSYALG